LCSIVNQAIRSDDRSEVLHAARLVRGISELHGQVALGPWPTDGVCWRGAGFPPEHRAFFTSGLKFRAPMFVASSFVRDKAAEFCYRAECYGHDPILWKILVDPRGEADASARCKNVGYVQHTNVQGEDEFLFAP
jgi:hypothetical protein